MERAAYLVMPTLLALAGPALASGGGEEGGSNDLLFSILNFVLILAVIFYFARKPMAEYLEQRRQGIQRNLEDSAKLLADAEAKLQDWNQRAGRLDAELAEIRETSRRIAEEEREAIPDVAVVIVDESPSQAIGSRGGRADRALDENPWNAISNGWKSWNRLPVDSLASNRHSPSRPAASCA